MKRVLFFALMAAAVVGCKQSTDMEPDEALTGGQVIALTSGEVAISRADGSTTAPTANQGTRVYFGLGDQIGVFAAYGNATTNIAPTGPDWADAVGDVSFKGRYFDNAPATCTTVGADAVPAKFTWGPAGEGGVAHEKLYPKKDRAIYAYAYYPLVTEADSITIDPTDGPKISYSLNTTAPLDQPDILWSIGKSKATAPLDSITRKDPLGILQFEHALAQINFILYKKDASVSNCALVDITLTVPTTGTMTLSKTVGNIALVSSKNDATNGKYTIATGDPNIGNSTVTEWDGTTNTEDKPRPASVLIVPYMIWPLTADQAQKCELVVRLYFGVGDPKTDTLNVREYKIDMTGMKPILQGKLNHFILGVTPTVINLEGQITPWGEDGQDSGLAIE